MADYVEIISKEKLQRIKEKGELARQRRAQERKTRLERKKKKYSADEYLSSSSTSSSSQSSPSADSSYLGDIFSSISQPLISSTSSSTSSTNDSSSSQSSDYNSPAFDFLGSLASAGLQEQNPQQIQQESLEDMDKAKSEMNAAYLEETFLEMAGKFQELETRLRKIEKKLGLERGEKDFAY